MSKRMNATVLLVECGHRNKISFKERDAIRRGKEMTFTCRCSPEVEQAFTNMIDPLAEIDMAKAQRRSEQSSEFALLNLARRQAQVVTADE